MIMKRYISAGADQYYIEGTEMEKVQQLVDFVQPGTVG